MIKEEEEEGNEKKNTQRISFHLILFRFRAVIFGEQTFQIKDLKPKPEP